MVPWYTIYIFPLDVFNNFFTINLTTLVVIYLSKIIKIFGVTEIPAS